MRPGNQKSLVRSETLPNGEPRFQLLETIREFALDALAALPNAALAQTRQRHAEYFLHLIEAARAVDIRARIRMMDAEQHNARTAFVGCWTTETRSRASLLGS